VNRADRRLYSGWGGLDRGGLVERLVMKAVTRVTSIETEGEMTPKITEREAETQEGKKDPKKW